MEDTRERIIIRTYEDENERGSFAVVEAGQGEVDMTIHPFTDDAVTISLTAKQAWALAREIARAATVLEQAD